MDFEKIGKFEKTAKAYFESDFVIFYSWPFASSSNAGLTYNNQAFVFEDEETGKVLAFDELGRYRRFTTIQKCYKKHSIP